MLFESVEKIMTKIERRIKNKEWRKNNPEKCRAKSIKYWTKNKDKARENYRKWASENKEYVKSYRTKYNLENKESRAVKRRSNTLIKNYGLTIEKFNAMLKSQSGCCAICEIPQTKLKKSLAVDHCHKTGKIRGLLCYLCNTAMGHFQDDIGQLNKVIDYLKKYNTPQEIDQTEYYI